MAATVAVLGTSVFNTTAGNKTITATPTVGDLIVIITAATGVATTIADNGTGGTYTQVDSTRTGFSTTGNLQMWVRDNLVSSAVSTIYTATQTASTGGGLVILRVTGMNVAGASAVRSTGGQSSGGAATTPAPVLSSTPLSTNPIITAVANASGTTTTLVQRAGYTEDFDNGYATPSTGLEVNHLTAGETTATLTQGGTSATAFASIAIELAHTLTINKSESVTISEGLISTNTYYFDAHTSTSDPGAAWTNDANLFDSNISTAAAGFALGSTASNYLQGAGTNAPSSGATISKVEARVRAADDDTSFNQTTVNAAIYSSGLAELLGTATVNTGPVQQYGSYTTLSTPSGGWSWTVLQELVTKVYKTETGGAGEAINVYIVELLVSTGTAVTVAVSGGGVSTPTISVSDTTTLTESVKAKFPVGSLTDNFDDNSEDAIKWPNSYNSAATRAETGGEVVFTLSGAGSNFTAYVSNALDLTGSSAYVKVPTMCNVATNAEAFLQLALDTNNTVHWIQEAGVLYAQYKVAASTTTAFSVAYNSSTHLWWSIREGAGNGLSGSAGNVYWDTSTDGTTWTNRASVANPIAINAVQVNLGAGTYQVETAPGTVHFDNFNVASSVVTPTINVNDTATTSESRTVLIPELLVNKSDSITLTESILRLVENNVSVSDSSTLSETTTPQIPVTVATSDSTTLSETLLRMVENRVAVADNSTLTEANSQVITPLMVTVSDSTTLTESIGALSTPNDSIQDTTTATENTQISVQVAAALNDTATTSESTQVVIPVTVITSDTATTSENTIVSIAGAAPANITVSDNTTLSESQTLLVENRINVSDSTTLTESISKAITPYYISVSDTATSSESLTSLSTPNDSIADTLTVTESVTLQMITSVAISDTLTATDTLRPVNVVTQIKAVSDNISVTESAVVIIAQAGTFNIIASDSTTITEIVSAFSTPNDSVQDALTATEAVSIAIGTTITRSDTVTVSENTVATIQAIATLAIATSDSASLSESSSVSIPSVVSTGYIKVWNGSAFVKKPVKFWNGSSWQTKPVKFWNGSSWITLT